MTANDRADEDIPEDAMADHRSDTPLGAAEAIGAALTGDAAMQTRREFRIAAFLIGLVVLVFVAVGLSVWMFGLVALNIAGLIATALVFFFLIAYAAGW